MMPTVLLILAVECFGVLLFILGYLLGLNHRKSPESSKPAVNLKDPPLDPISPADQLLAKKLEEALRNGIVREEEED